MEMQMGIWMEGLRTMRILPLDWGCLGLAWCIGFGGLGYEDGGL